MSSCTFGKMCATIAFTPAALGCSPSACRSVRSAAVSGQEEGIEQHPVFGGELRIDTLEGARIIGPEVGHGPHAAQENGDMALAQPLQNPVERRIGYLRIDSAQHVVGAQLEDHGIGVRRHRPVEPRETAARRIAGDAGIFELCGDAFGRQCGLEPRHKAIVAGQSQTRRQGIAERHDLDGRRTVSGWDSRTGREQYATKRSRGGSAQHLAQAARRNHMSCHASPMRGAGRLQT